MGQTVGYDVLSGIAICVHNDLPPSDADWDRMLALFAARLDTLGGALVLAHGPGPNAAQRKRLADALGSRIVPTAVVTDSILARGAITALRWLGHAISCYAPADVDAALAILPMGPGLQRSVMMRAIELRCEVSAAPAPRGLAALEPGALKRELVAARGSARKSA